MAGGVTGRGIEKNIRDLYQFLSASYEPDDEIYLFGFSRGAYTVRSLVGMIRNVGILTSSNTDKIDEAWALYRSRGQKDHPDAEGPKQFKEEFSHSANITFLGVWDTVGALGIPTGLLRIPTLRKHRFHDVRLSSIVLNAFQALAIDEHRQPFSPSIWSGPAKPGQTVEQVWFPGVHSDIGGGNTNDGLADVAFDWLTSKARNCGLALDKGFIDSKVDAYPNGPRHDSMSLMYRLFGNIDRKIGKNSPSSEEWIHYTVIDRTKDAIYNYNPKNLQTFIGEHPDRITERP